jgi:hypothetical protein
MDHEEYVMWIAVVDAAGKLISPSLRLKVKSEFTNIPAVSDILEILEGSPGPLWLVRTVGIVIHTCAIHSACPPSAHNKLGLDVELEPWNLTTRESPLFLCVPASTGNFNNPDFNQKLMKQQRKH